MTRSPAGDPAGDGDERIVDLIRAGSVDEGVRMLMEQHGPAVYGALRQRFSDVHDQDIQQAIHDVVLTLCGDVDVFDASRGSPRGWILKSATNNTLNLIRARAARPLLDLGETDFPARENPSRSEATKRELEILGRCIGMLSEHQQHIILSGLANQHDSDTELAEQLKTTAGAIGTERHKAMQRLGRLMEQERERP